MKTTLVPIGLALLIAGVARADFDPILLTPESFTADVVVEKTAPPPMQSFTTASMDDGTNNNSWVWYEMGFDATRPSTGLPAPGSVFSATADPNHTFKMPASYTAPNALLLTINGHPTGTLTLSTPRTAAIISVLGTVSGGDTTLDYTIHYQGGATESAQILVPDWFNGTPGNVAYIANGRVNVGNGQTGSQYGNNPRLFYLDIYPGNSGAAITSISFTTPRDSRTVLFGLSTTPDGVTYTPADVTGFNRDMVVEATAPLTGSLYTKCNVIMDSGATNISANTWYEKGFNTAAPNTGLPTAGSTISGGSPLHSFTMPPSYIGNNVVYIGNYEGYTTGTLTLTTPTALQALSFLNAAGNGPVNITVTVWHADTSSEVLFFNSPDWFNQGGAIYTAAGRFNPASLALNDVNTSNPRLYASDITLGNTTSPVTKIDFAYTSGGRSMIFAVAGQASPGGAFTPLAVTGFTADGVVEASAYRYPNPLYTATSASMDGGTNNVANTWYEQGYYALRPQTGLPPAGSQITSLTLPDHHYTMPATYTGNNAIFVDSTFTNANLTLATPATYSALSFLSACANGRVTNSVVMQYEDGTAETNFYTSLDWFGGTPYAFTSRGRMDLNNRTVNNVGSDNPRLYEAQFALGNTTSPLTNIILGFQGAQNTSGRMFVFAVSGTAGAVPPILSAVSPANVRLLEGMNQTFSATLSGGTEPITFQWQKQDGENWVNVSDGGIFSGATTKDLTLTGATLANTGTYRLTANNAAGPAFSSLATLEVLSGLADITTPGDPTTPLNGASSGAEGPASAINNTVQKYLNFDEDSASPFVGPVGFVVTPSIGSTIVSGLRIYTANDADGRDPADFTLEGSNDGGQTWTVVASSALALPTARNDEAGTTPINPLTMDLQEVLFANSTPYASYRVSFQNVRNNGGVNCVQLAEVELLGVVASVPPVIVRHPGPTATVYAGASPRFSVEATGTQPLSYQWYRNNVEITGATSDTYILANAQASDSGSTFKCRVTNPNGFVDSNPATLSVITAPTQPYPSAILADVPMGYWRLNEVDNGAGNTGVEAKDLAGGHNGVFNNVYLQQSGYNPGVDADTAGLFGSYATSDSYVGNIRGIDFAAPQGTSVSFTVEAWVNGNGQFQTFDAGIVTKGYSGAEQFNLDTGAGGSSLRALRFFVRDASGATHGANGTKTINQDGAWHHVVGVCDMPNGKVTLYIDGQPAGSGTIDPEAGILSSSTPVSIGSRQSGPGDPYSNQFYGLIDDVAVYDYALTHEQVLSHYYGGQFPPVVITAPSDAIANEGGTATFEVEAYGAPALSYQWYDVSAGDPGTLIPGQTTSTLTINNVTLAHNGRSYRAVVSNPYGSVSAPDLFLPPAVLSVISGPPTFTTNLSERTFVYTGRDAKLSVAVSGSEPITYSWRSNGVTLVNGGRISGAQTATLTIANAQPGDAANYQVFVSNTYGGPIGSVTTALIVDSVITFNTDGTGWTVNGNGGGITNGVLTLSTAGSHATSAFLDYPLYIGGFRASFTYQDVGGGGADGFAFVLQNDERGPKAVGPAGGALAYGGIAPSAAVLFNIYNGSGIDFRVNGNTGSPYQPTTPVDIANGNPIDIVIEYFQGVARLSLTDTVTSETLVVDIETGDLQAIVGAQTAYVGFTGASGGIASYQNVSNVEFVPLPGLSAERVADTLKLSWPVSVGGFALEQSNSLDSWQPVASPATVVGDQYQVTISPLTGTRFFRLVLPVQ